MLYRSINIRNENVHNYKELVAQAVKEREEQVSSDEATINDSISSINRSTSNNSSRTEPSVHSDLSWDEAAPLRNVYYDNIVNSLQIEVRKEKSLGYDGLCNIAYISSSMMMIFQTI